jgi:hypothetical protein
MPRPSRSPARAARRETVLFFFVEDDFSKVAAQNENLEKPRAFTRPKLPKRPRSASRNHFRTQPQ